MFFCIYKYMYVYIYIHWCVYIYIYCVSLFLYVEKRCPPQRCALPTKKTNPNPKSFSQIWDLLQKSCPKKQKSKRPKLNQDIILISFLSPWTGSFGRYLWQMRPRDKRKLTETENGEAWNLKTLCVWEVIGHPVTHTIWLDSDWGINLIGDFWVESNPFIFIDVGSFFRVKKYLRISVWKHHLQIHLWEAN